MKFIATIRDKDTLSRELQMLHQKYSGSHPYGISYCINPKEFCYEFKIWMVSGFDSSFSTIRNAIDDCRVCYEQADNVAIVCKLRSK